MVVDKENADDDGGEEDLGWARACRALDSNPVVLPPSSVAWLAWPGFRQDSGNDADLLSVVLAAVAAARAWLGVELVEEVDVDEGGNDEDVDDVVRFAPVLRRLLSASITSSLPLALAARALVPVSA